MANTQKLPNWIFYYALLQMASALVGVYSGYIDATLFYNQFPESAFSEPLVKHLAAVWASKNLAFLVVMAWSIIRKQTEVLATVFAIKGIADTLDILYSNNAFLPDTGFLLNATTWLLLGLPQLVIAYILFTQRISTKQEDK